MFSPLGGPREEEKAVDWLSDLKFFIDNDDMMLKKHIFPAVEKHKRFVDHPDAYKLYINPLRSCVKTYCEAFEIEDEDEKFPADDISSLARTFAEEQKKHIEKKDYERK